MRIEKISPSLIKLKQLTFYFGGNIYPTVALRIN